MSPTDRGAPAPEPAPGAPDELTLRDRLARTGRRLARGIEAVRGETAELRADVVELQSQVDALRTEVRQLQRDAHQDRRLQRRVAELTDIMQELLLPAAGRDEQRLSELLEDYRGH